MDFQSHDLSDKYISFDDLLSIINNSTSSHSYIIIKKKTKVSKKKVLKKTV